MVLTRALSGQPTHAVSLNDVDPQVLSQLLQEVQELETAYNCNDEEHARNAEERVKGLIPPFMSPDPSLFSKWTTLEGQTYLGAAFEELEHVFGAKASQASTSPSQEFKRVHVHLAAAHLRSWRTNTSGQSCETAIAPKCVDAHHPASSPSCSTKPFSVNEKLCQITIDEEVHKVTSEAARMAALLLQDIGDWTSMSRHGFSKPSRVKDDLPPQVQVLIETEKGKGYRLKRQI